MGKLHIVSIKTETGIKGMMMDPKLEQLIIKINDGDNYEVKTDEVIVRHFNEERKEWETMKYSYNKGYQLYSIEFIND